jgi:Domain of unknown function (DUF4783)
MKLIKFVYDNQLRNLVYKQFIMIKKSYIPVSVMLLSFLTTTAQEQAKIPAGIPMAFRAGNATELSKYFNSTVQIMLLGKEDFYKKNLAEDILKDFFVQYRTRDFIIRHQGGTNDAQYAIGSLKTDKGDFRVYFLLKKVGTELLIHQIRIEPDDGK